jgi:membrane protein DedA with SNARE-associated domain
MVEVIQSLLDYAAEHPALLLVCVLVFALVDAALGIGAFLPGETAVVFAAMALAHNPWQIAAAVVAAAVGAFLGDHIGFLVGRHLGDRIGQTSFVRRMGAERWDQARRFVARRFWLVVVARLLPSVRTLVAAAVGASTMRYARFASACALAAVLWATIWVVGGALVGHAFLVLVENYTVPVLSVAAAGTVVAVLLVGRSRRRNA